MSLLLENEHKKALVRLVLKDENKSEVELGFATKVYIPEKEDILLITSPSIFPDNIDTRLDDIVIHRWMPKPKRKRNPPKVRKIENHEQADVSTVEFEGDDKKYCLPYEVLSEEKKKKHKMLTACLFDGKKKIELQFENHGGSYKLSKVSKEDFDVKRAKGAPVILQERTHTFIGHPRYARKIVGVLFIDSNGDLYPVLFKQGFLVDQLPDQVSQTQKGTSAEAQKQLQPTLDNPNDAVGRIERKVDQLLDQEHQAQKSSSAEAQPGEDVKTTIPRTTSENTERNYAEDSEKLKEAIKSNTEYQTKFMAAHDITSEKTDQIFTSLTVYYADKKQVKKEQAEGLSRSKLLREYTKRETGVKVEKYQDIFIATKEKKNPKLLLTGKPGIGKTFFCEKIIRDWSMNRSFKDKENTENNPKIQFAYLLKFRQLQGDKDTNLKELLNCSPLLDDSSKIDDSLFEYLIQNPSEVLIILDGFDEYSQQHREQISSVFEQNYPNDSRAEMPIPALCSKLIQGKLLKNSVVLVSSRPGEAEELGEITFDRYVEISGFSPEQVSEYVDKYFSEPEKQQAKDTVRNHVLKNENLVSFCHIPLLSFLLCWCLEFRISQSGITENLPAKITDIYDEVVKVVVQKLHAKLKYLKMSGNTRKIAEDTLNKLAKLAANLLKHSKYIFDEEDMKNVQLIEEEIQNLKVSGILHCIPIRISAFIRKSEFTFIHLTLQEYLSACFFVKNKEIPEKEEATGQTLVFMSGLFSGEKDGKLMNKLIQQITPQDEGDDVNKLQLLHCLYEYGDVELTKLTINNLYGKYCDSLGWFTFRGVSDVDVKCLSYFLDIIHSLKQHHPHPYPDYVLYIVDSSLTSFGVGVVCDSLVRNSFITGLLLGNCSLDDKCVDKITNLLVNSKITYLLLSDNDLTNKGAESICRVIIQPDCHVEELYLENNKNITEECKKTLRQLVVKHKPGVIFYI